MGHDLWPIPPIIYRNEQFKTKKFKIENSELPETERMASGAYDKIVLQVYIV